jgi:hypothetical protein
MGAGLALVLMVLGGTGWHVASRRTDTDGLIAQVGMLVAIFQAILGLAIALATGFYAMRTHDMAASIEASRSAERSRDRDAAVGNLVAAALSVGAAAGALAGLTRRSWRWYLPGSRALRERLLGDYALRLTVQMTEARRWSEDVSRRETCLRSSSRQLMEVVLEVHECSTKGRSAATIDAVRRLRNATDALRANMADRIAEENASLVPANPR